MRGAMEEIDADLEVEDARAATGYATSATTPAPTRPAPASIPRCRECNTETTALYNRPGDSGRTVCMSCQGKLNRGIQDRIRQCVITLKTSSDPYAERQAELDLISLCGREEADATIKAIADGRATGKYSKDARR